MFFVPVIINTTQQKAEVIVLVINAAVNTDIIQRLIINNIRSATNGIYTPPHSSIIHE